MFAKIFYGLRHLPPACLHPQHEHDSLKPNVVFDLEILLSISFLFDQLFWFDGVNNRSRYEVSASIADKIGISISISFFISNFHH
jgi:hypothetical protein